MKNFSINLYKNIYLIRTAEEAIISVYESDEMKTPMHMSMGEEAIICGIISALGNNAQTFGTYRSHALYLAVTGDTDGFFAELYGKVNGPVHGKGGSMHLMAPEKGLLATSAVVASTIPVAVGAAYTNKTRKNKKVVAVFFGDGAIDEGVFWESLNFACLLKLPILFVLEDNGLAVHTSDLKRHGYKSIDAIVKNFNCKVVSSSTTDVEKIYKIAKSALKNIKAASKPIFLHLKYYRYLEHVGINEDFSVGYRSKKDFESWYKVDPLIMQRKRLLNKGISKQLINKIEEKIKIQIEQSILKAKGSNFPSKQDLYKDVFSETKRK